jgi:uncharacterized membrane protein YczE
MSPVLRTILYVVVLLIGIILMVGGIDTGKHGATVVGLICAAVSVQQWMKWRKEQTENHSDTTAP